MVSNHQKRSKTINSNTMKTAKLVETEPTTQNGQEVTQIKVVKPIENSPFTAVKYGDNWFLALGNYRLTEPLETEEAVKDEVNNTSWERLLSVMHAVADVTFKQLNKNSK